MKPYNEIVALVFATLLKLGVVLPVLGVSGEE